MKSKKITIKTTIEIKVDKNNNLLINNTELLIRALGTTSVMGNYKIYGVTKVGNKFSVPMKVIKERINILKGRVDKAVESIAFMEQLIVGGQK